MIPKKVLSVRTALQLVLTCVDYTHGACAPNTMVGAALSKETINLALEALDPPCMCTGVGPNTSSMICPRHADNKWEG